ncbi:MAG: aldehyde dehydrogenase family protein [Bacteroidetes bacterium]|nr:aldehyde dehydrogenase family protein [Bacteroidota bacterium]
MRKSDQDRIEVLKTCKIFIGGKFPRTESGRYYVIKDRNGQPLANMCRSSRKDYRDAVVAARNAFEGWSSVSAMNRGQILYRIAEMMEERKEQFTGEIVAQGENETRRKRDKGKTRQGESRWLSGGIGRKRENQVTKDAVREVEQAIDRVVYYAGWCDKFQQIFSTVNPVASPHFNFSRPEPMGVVAVIASEEPAMLGLVSMIAPVIAGGNTCVVLASETKPLTAVSFSEVIHTSDVPGGVINILTGLKSELYGHFSSHMDVNAVIFCGNDNKIISEIRQNGSVNVKRAIIHKNIRWEDNSNQNPYLIKDTMEIKTTWHPVGV